MTATYYPIEQVRDHLMSLDDAREILARTEPLVTVPIDAATGASFRLLPHWNSGLDNVSGLDLVDAYISIDNHEYQMTKDAALEATSICGLPKAYVARTPSEFIEPQLNYWYSGNHLSNEYKALIRGHESLAALNKSSIVPFSNLRLVEEALGGIEQKYGKGEILVDKKFQHSLQGTKLRLVIPEKQRVIERTGTPNDSWSAGLELNNSQVGLSQTSVSGYLFRYFCTNGSTVTHASSGGWSRRAGQGNEVYAWARAAVDDVLGGLEGALDAVQELADTSIQGVTVNVMQDLFRDYRIPPAQRDQIISSMVDETNLTYYSLMQAITSVANNTDLKPELVDRLLTVGGDLPYTITGRCDSCHQVIR